MILLDAIKDMPNFGKERCFIGVDWEAQFFQEGDNCKIVIVDELSNIIWKWQGDIAAPDLSFGIAVMLEGKVRGGRVAISRNAFGLVLIKELISYVPKRKIIAAAKKGGSFMDRIHRRILPKWISRAGITSDKISSVMSNNNIIKKHTKDVSVISWALSLAVTAAAITNPWLLD